MTLEAEGDVLDVLVKSWRNRGGNKLMPEYGFLPVALVTDYLRSYKAAARD